METTEKPPRLYVIVRSNISRSQQAIQAGHAVAKFVTAYPNAWPNRTLLYLRVADEASLMVYYERLKQVQDKIVLYSDPSWNNATSVGVFGSPEVQEIVKDLSLI